jgi:hypothetical protein
MIRSHRPTGIAGSLTVRRIAGTLRRGSCVAAKGGGAVVGADVVGIAGPGKCLAASRAHQPAAHGGRKEHLDHLPSGYRLGKPLRQFIESLIFHRLVPPFQHENPI